MNRLLRSVGPSSSRRIAAGVAAAVLLGLFVVAFRGCDSDRVPLVTAAGTVWFADGEPVRTGVIELESREHETTSSGRIGPDGTFSLGTYEVGDGAPAGDHRAIIVQLIIDDGTVTHEVDHGRSVPLPFRDYDTTPLRITLPADGNDDLQLILPE